MLTPAMAELIVSWTLITIAASSYSNNVFFLRAVLPELAVFISGPPIKDPGALLRYALPIDSKAIGEVQKPLEDITDSLKVSGVEALDSVEREHL
ncbi:hypothetical protein Tco_1555580 [Tanacetum coccineum]